MRCRYQDFVGVAAACVIAVSLAAASTAHAYRTASDTDEFAGEGAIAWERAPSIAIASDLPDGLEADDAIDALRASAATWSAVGCADLSLEREVLEDADSDADIVVRWVDDWDGEGFGQVTPGSTDVEYEREGDDDRWYIVRATISLNAQDHEWNGGGPDLQAVLTHELGHALGLMHVCEQRGSFGAPACEHADAEYRRHALYPRYLGEQQRELSGDDAAGLCFLYPRSSSEAPTRGSVASGDCDRSALEDGCAATGCPDGDCELLQLGDPCDEAGACASGECSDAGRCTETCYAGTGCPASFRCDSGEGVVGQCVPDALAFGDYCSEASQCASLRCIRTAETRGDEEPDAVEESYCTRTCTPDGDSCPPAYSCAEILDRHVCVLRAHLNESSTTCAVGLPAGRVPLPTLFVLSALALGLAVRRRRSLEKP